MTTTQSAREICRNDDECIKVETPERIFRVFRAPVLTHDFEIHVLRQRVDEASAFCCETFIHYAKTQVADFGVQGKSEDDQDDGGRKHQLNQKNAIAPQLLNFLGGERNVTSNRRRHESLLCFELHFAHLNHIQSEEGKGQYQQRNDRLKRGGPSYVPQNGVADNPYVMCGR